MEPPETFMEQLQRSCHDRFDGMHAVFRFIKDNGPFS